MTKAEFLQALADKLAEDLPPEAVGQEIRYYEGFIDGELGRGLDEETVTDRLGDPILIARNIAESPRGEMVYQDDAYSEGVTAAQYQEVREVSDWVKEEVEQVFDAGEKNPFEKAAEYAGEKAEDFADRRSGEADPEKEAEREVRKAFISSLFKLPDGSVNWRLIGTLGIVILALVMVLSVVAKVVATFFPVICVLAVVWIVYTFVIKGRMR